MFFKKALTIAALTCLSLPVVSPLLVSGTIIAQSPNNEITQAVPLDEAHFPDPNFRKLISEKADTNKDNQLSREEILNLRSLSAKPGILKDLTGIEYFTELIYVYFDYNQITKADFSNNKKLESLIIANNRLTSIKLPNQEENNTLTYLDVFANKLTSLDLTNLKVLNFLHADDNRLTFLDLSHSPLDSGHGFVAMHNILDKIILPNNNRDYPWAEYLAEQQEIDGYKNYWYTDEAKTQRIDPKTTPTIKLTGQTLYTVHAPITYQITYLPSDLGSGQAKTQTLTYDQKTKLLKNTFTANNPDYVFDYWENTSNKKRYYDEQEVLNLSVHDNDQITLVARYKKGINDVIIHAQDQQIVAGSAFDLKKAVSAVDGNGKDITASLEVLDDGGFDINKPGKYQVTYQATNDQGLKKQLTITITVKAKASEINLPPTISAQNITLTQGQSFEPLKYATAKDAAGQDLSTKLSAQSDVKTDVPGTYHVTYQVTDANNITVKKTIVVTVLPKLTAIFPAPTITANDVTLEVGASFVPTDHANAQAFDGSDLSTQLLVVKNDVNPSQPGTYHVTYQVTDANRITVTKTITVTVVAKQVEPDVPVKPEQPNVPTPEIPETPETPEIPEDSEIPEMPEQPEVPSQPTKPSQAEVSNTPSTSVQTTSSPLDSSTPILSTFSQVEPTTQLTTNDSTSAQTNTHTEQQVTAKSTKPKAAPTKEKTPAPKTTAATVSAPSATKQESSLTPTQKALVVAGIATTGAAGIGASLWFFKFKP